MGAGESSIADQLYDAVLEELVDDEKCLAGKITGMLLEADQQSLEIMLTSRSVLRLALERTKITLNSVGYAENDNKPVLEADSSDGETQEDLGDILYEKIAMEHPEHASKLTGMLLELDACKLKEALNSRTLFDTVLEKAMNVLNNTENTGRQFVPYEKANHDRSTQSHNKRRLCESDPDYSDLCVSSCDESTYELFGDILYERVAKMYPDEAPKITGMLLEFDACKLKEALNSRTLFDAVLEKAMNVLNNTQNTGRQFVPHDRSTLSHNKRRLCESDPDDSDLCVTSCDESTYELFGDILYERVAKIYPDEAPKITGMMLELDKDTLETLLQDDRALQEAARKARLAIL